MQQRGFTLVELIITLIIIGVLAVTAIPRFFGSQSEDAFALRDRTLALVRTVQLQAMHDFPPLNECESESDPDPKCQPPPKKCLRITATLIAPPKGFFCDEDISSAFDEQWIVDSSDTGLTFSTTDNNGGSFSLLEFDPLGEPNLNCSNTCEIQIANQSVCVSDAGAVYGC